MTDLVLVFALTLLIVSAIDPLRWLVRRRPASNSTRRQKAA
jgi:hypothetical protein